MLSVPSGDGRDECVRDRDARVQNARGDDGHPASLASWCRLSGRCSQHPKSVAAAPARVENE